MILSGFKNAFFAKYMRNVHDGVYLIMFFGMYIFHIFEICIFCVWVLGADGWMFFPAGKRKG